MSLENWDSYPDPQTRRQKINDYLDHLLDLETDSNNQSIYIPAVEIKETNQAFYIKLEIPGITKRQIDLEITSNIVTVKGERTFIKDIEDEKLIFSSFPYGKWQRIVFLPVPITIHGAIAEYVDGILTIVVYKLCRKKFHES